MKPFNSRTADKFVIRLPDGMRERLADVAKGHLRSMNSEIIRRLEDSFKADASAPVEEQKEKFRGLWCPGVGELCEHEHFGVGKIEDFEIHSDGSVFARVTFGVDEHSIEVHPTPLLQPFAI